MDRVLQHAAATLSVTLTDAAGDPVDATGTPTVAVTRDDGTAVAAGAVAHGTTGVYTTTLAPTATGTLDRLTADWTATIGGVASQVFRTRAEVVGGFLFQIADARKLNPLADTTKYPSSLVALARTAAEVALEEACGVAFVPRYGHELLDGNGGTDVLLDRPRPRSIVSLKVDGVAVTGDDLAAVKLYRDGRLYRAANWTEGRQNLEVVYEHGFDAAPGRVALAAIQLAKYALVDTPISDRFTSVHSDEGSFSLLTAGMRGALFGVAEANAVVEQYGMTVGIA